jgi:protein-export membrane protein SecD
MSSRGSWRLGIVILVLALAVVFSLNLDFPEWVEEMLFWRTAGQRQVELRYGSELEEGLQIKLLPSFGYQPDAATFESARQVLQDRLAGHEPAGASVEVLGDGILLVELQGIRERVWLTDTLQSIGLIEFIDASLRYAEPGTVVETDLDAIGQPKPEDTVSTGLVVTPTTTEEQTGVVYDTVLSSAELAAVALGQTSETEYYIQFLAAAGAQSEFAAFTGTHAGDYLCVAVDKLVLSCPKLPDTRLEGVVNMPGIRLTTEAAALYEALLASGPLPVPLQIWETAVLGPALGEGTVRLVALGAAIGLAAVALFLLAHYRLAGLVAVAALVAFGLTAIALCKLVPLPLTLCSLAGLVVAGVVAVGSVITTFERLREEKRARGLISLRSIGSALSSVRATVGSVHFALLALAVLLWYVGLRAETPAIVSLGEALLFGTLASFVVARLVAAELARLVLGTTREPLNRSVWLLGI